MEKLEYLESTGTQNINLNYILTSTARVQIGIMPTCISSKHFIKTENDIESQIGEFRLFNSNSKFYFDYGKVRVSNNIGEFYKYQYYDIEMGNSYIKVNGNEIASSSSIEYTFNTSLNVFAYDCVRLYYIKIYDILESGNRELVKSFIPIIDDEGNPCLQDELTLNKYYADESADTENPVEDFILGKFSIYSSVEDALAAEDTNMTQIVTNKTIPMGSGQLIFHGAEWLDFNNKNCKYLYSNSHSYWGFGANQTDLTIFKSDYTYCYNIWREIGAIAEYKFVKFRWEGYTISVSESTKLLYDIYFFNTGDIYIHIGDKNSYCTIDNSVLTTSAGTYNLKISYKENDVSLYKISDINEYSIEKNIITFKSKKNVIEKFLLSTYKGYYTIKDGEFIFLTQAVVDNWGKETPPIIETPEEVPPNTEENSSNTEEIAAPINAELFRKCGFLDIPTQTQLLNFYTKINENEENLINFDLIGWWEDNLASSSIKMNTNALPKPQSIISDRARIPYTTKIGYDTAIGIENVVIDCEGDILFQISFTTKNEQTMNWQYWDGEWKTSELTDVVGMSKETFQSITTEQWQELFDGSDYITIKMILTEKNQKFNSLVLNFKKQIVKA